MKITKQDIDAFRETVAAASYIAEDAMNLVMSASENESVAIHAIATMAMAVIVNNANPIDRQDFIDIMDSLIFIREEFMKGSEHGIQ